MRAGSIQPALTVEIAMEDFDEYTDSLFDVPEYRYAEFRAVDGRTVHGTAVVYGDVATRPGGVKEMFMPGAFGDVSALDCILHVQHTRDRPLARTGGGGLALTDSPERLEVAAEMPPTRDGDDCLELIQRGILRGFSNEFFARRDRCQGDTRIIETALLSGVGLVDIPSYPQSRILEVRASGDGLKGSFAYDRDVHISDSGKVRKQRFKAGSFTYAIEQPDREITLTLGDGSRQLASKQSGSLILKDTPQALTFEVKQLPKTSYAKDFLALLRAGSVAPGVIPIFSRVPRSVSKDADFDEEEKGNPGVFRRVFNSALLTGLSILLRPPRGNPGILQSIFGRRPKKPARVSPFARPRVRDGETLIRPKQGDVVRRTRDGYRVIRDGQDIGPALRHLWI